MPYATRYTQREIQRRQSDKVAEIVQACTQHEHETKVAMLRSQRDELLTALRQLVDTYTAKPEETPAQRFKRHSDAWDTAMFTVIKYDQTAGVNSYQQQTNH
jgi:hypothetical protein